jgi:hypothetical protein
MSLGDQLRYLRARRGGPSLSDVSRAIGEPNATRVQALEHRYRDTSDDDLIRRLAAYYGVPEEELQWHRRRSRRDLALHVHAAMQSGHAAILHLRNGDTLAGSVAWWDLSAIGLKPTDGGPLVVVQRHAVVDWQHAEDP